MVHQGVKTANANGLWDSLHTAAALRTARHHAGRWAARHGRNPADRADLAQDILLAALDRSERFDPDRGAWTTFVDLIARHVVAGRCKAESHRPKLLAMDLAALDAAASAQAGASAWRDGDSTASLYRLALRDVLEVLPEEPRETLALLILTDGDIAAACRASGCSSSSFYRAVADLRFWLRAVGLAPATRCAGKNRELDR